MKKPIAQFLIWSVFLNPPLYAQQAIEIEIDSAPVEVEIHQPVPAEKPEEPSQQTAETDEEPTKQKEKSTKKRNYGVAIAVGAIVAGALAALGGGGGGGSTDSTPQH